jgi:hypothetical protein
LVTIVLEWRDLFANTEVNALHAEGLRSCALAARLVGAGESAQFYHDACDFTATDAGLIAL